MTDHARPVLSITEAAIATGKSRRTIARLLDAGRLDGAERDDAGTWRIPVEALIAAGLTLYAPRHPTRPRRRRHLPRHLPTRSTPSVPSSPIGDDVPR